MSDVLCIVWSCGGSSDYAPSVDIIKNAFSICVGVRCHANIFLHPCNDMVLERALDELVEDVGREELMYVGTWKIVREGLNSMAMTVC